MAFANPNTPNLPDFILYCQNQGVSAGRLPPTSEYFQWAFGFAQNTAIVVPEIPGPMYCVAVYNLGLHQLLKIAQDQPGQDFFAQQRQAFNLLSFVTGPVVSSGDQGTNETLGVPDFVKGLTFSALDLMKTPWGRDYLDYAQQYGPTVVGIS